MTSVNKDILVWFLPSLFGCLFFLVNSCEYYIKDWCCDWTSFFCFWFHKEFLPFSTILARSLLQLVFIILLYVLYFLSQLYHGWMLELVGECSVSFEMIMRFSSWLVSVWCITFPDLCKLNHSCIIGMKPSFSWSMIFSMICCILLVRIILGIFVSIFIKEIGLLFSFFG